MPFKAPHSLGHENNFGLLRLLLATLVIVSHSPELVDGNRSREILTILFGTLSFGEVAVDGFFLVSGYLITKSWVQSRGVMSYLTKRICRIVPAYLVAFLICVFAIAPLAGAIESAASGPTLLRLVSEMFWLSPPDLAGVFAGLHYPYLDGSMWTIAYEFRCYLAVAVIGLAAPSLPGGRWALFAIVLMLIGLNAVGGLREVHFAGERTLGTLASNVKLFAAFGVGSLFCLFSDQLRITHFGAAVSLFLLIPLLFFPALAEAAFIVLGGYLLFWFAFRFPALKVCGRDNETDISYGVYLYAWPVESLLIWYHPAINPWAACLLTALSAAALGFASWTLVEAPAMQFAQRRGAARNSTTHADLIPLKAAEDLP